MALTQISSDGVKDGAIVNADINASAAIAFSKLQDVSATDRILGRDSSGAGDIEEITPANVRTMLNVEDGADVTDSTNVNAAGAVMNSDLDVKGELLVGDGSGDPSALSVGTNDYVLTADSSEATGVKWAAAAGGGKILQVIHSTYSTESSTGNTEVTTGLACTITPSATNSKIYINFRLANVRRHGNDYAYARIKLYRGDAAYGSGTQSNLYQSANGAGYHEPSGNNTLDIGDNGGIWLDSPNTTSATTYTATIMNIATSGTIYWSTNHSTSSMVVMEVSA